MGDDVALGRKKHICPSSEQDSQRILSVFCGGGWGGGGGEGYPKARGGERPPSLETKYPIEGMIVYCSPVPSATSPGLFKTPLKSYAA
jgi:hypothetical protein